MPIQLTFHTWRLTHHNKHTHTYQHNKGQKAVIQFFCYILRYSNIKNDKWEILGIWTFCLFLYSLVCSTFWYLNNSEEKLTMWLIYNITRIQRKRVWHDVSVIVTMYLWLSDIVRVLKKILYGNKKYYIHLKVHDYNYYFFRNTSIIVQHISCPIQFTIHLFLVLILFPFLVMCINKLSSIVFDLLFFCSRPKAKK